MKDNDSPSCRADQHDDQHDDDDPDFRARRTLLKAAVYVPPAIIGTLLISRDAMAGQSSCRPCMNDPTCKPCKSARVAPAVQQSLCTPSGCAPDTCSPKICGPLGTDKTSKPAGSCLPNQ